MTSPMSSREPLAGSGGSPPHATMAGGSADASPRAGGADDSNMVVDGFGQEARVGALVLLCAVMLGVAQLVAWLGAGQVDSWAQPLSVMQVRDAETLSRAEN